MEAHDPAGVDEGMGDDFRSLVAATPAALFVFGAERVLLANAAAEELTGAGAEELLRQPFWELFGGGSRERVRRIEGDRLAGKAAPERYEVSLRRGDGQQRRIGLAARRVNFGGAPAVLATAFDVTGQQQATAALKEKEALLKLAQRAGRSITWDWNTLTDEVTVSETAAEIFAFAADQPPRTREEVCRFVHPDDREPLQEAVQRALRSGEPLSVEVRLRTGGEGLYWVLLRGRSHQVRPGWAVRMVGVATDITERRRAEEALHREKERAQVTLGSIGDGVVRTNSQGRIDYMNPAAETVTGWTLAEAAGKPLMEVFNVVDQVSRQPIVDPVERCLVERRAVVKPGKDLLLRRDGSEVEIRHTTTLIQDRGEGVAGAVLVLKDLTELRTVEREMLYLATHDGLTGLYNRTEFERRLARALTSAREEDRVHALCYLDLDEFKLINDTCGHLAGDEMLGQIGSLLKCRFRETDVLGRLGGDEFGVLLENCPPARAMEIARDLSKDIRSFRFSWKENIFSVGSSVGLVAIGPGSGDVAQLLSAADAACYLAKEKGGNRVQEYFADDSDLAERYGQVKLIQRIHAALDSEAFRLHCQSVQPLVAAPGDPLFYEVLVRMVEEGGELVLPAAFIPVAERHRLVSAIDRWVVRTALACLAEGCAPFDGEACFAINLSGQSLGDERFLEFVMEELKASGLVPWRILFEITETASISHLGRAMHFISMLRGKGCRFVLDDFGSGLSSFAYLRNLPVDYIKIDGQFVRRLTRDPIHRALVESINHIGHVMQLKTIAEAVEDEETLEALRRMRVDYAQGYWIAEPAPLPLPSAPPRGGAKGR
jgi:diguanylate cyclase (GGDEF)-like protein/PAS domain S-box-containing protein